MPLPNKEVHQVAVTEVKPAASKGDKDQDQENDKLQVAVAVAAHHPAPVAAQVPAAAQVPQAETARFRFEQTGLAETSSCPDSGLSPSVAAK
jgi:hypothetical protein